MPIFIFNCCSWHNIAAPVSCDIPTPNPVHILLLEQLWGTIFVVFTWMLLADVVKTLLAYVTSRRTGGWRICFTCLYIGITHHSWFTHDSLVYYIRHYGGKYDCIHYVFHIRPYDPSWFLEFGSIYNKADNPAVCYLIAIKLFCLIYQKCYSSTLISMN